MRLYKHSLFYGVLLLFILAACGRGRGMGQEGAFSASSQNDRFATADLCANCHEGLVDEVGNEVSLYSEWSGTMMANAAKDPLWRAKMQAESLAHPTLQTTIEATCGRCHTPIANVEARVRGETLSLTGSGVLSVDNSDHNFAMEGVGCTLCHQIQGGNFGAVGSFSGGYLIDQVTPRPERRIYGPYNNPFDRPMIQGASFTPVKNSSLESSEHCATCHTLFTPVVDAQSQPTGAEFPEQTPYLEWKESQFGSGDVNDDLSCQDCHMPLAQGGVVISNRPSQMLSKRSPFHRHNFVGANAWMLGIFKNNAADLSPTGSVGALAKNEAANRAYLAQETAKLTLASSQIAGGKLSLVVKIENLSGHKLPTAYPSRRVWVRLVAKDANGVFFSSGDYDSQGKIAGNEADLLQGGYEPHYDRITQGGQVQIYETIAQNSDHQVTYGLLRAASHLKDNRLFPKGFVAAQAAESVAVHGAATADPNFTGGSDSVQYEIDLGGRTGNFTLEVSLLYQAAGYAFLRDLFQYAAQGDQVARMKALSQAAGGGVEVIGSLSKAY